MGDYKWHFAKTGGSDEEGLEDAGLSYFKSDPHHYIARETIQNVLDAKDDNKKGEPAVVEFKLFKAPTAEAIADIETYKTILTENIESNNSNPSAKKFFKNALRKINNQQLDILCISDSSTVGVKDINKDRGRWHGLIKMKGKGSQQQRNIGGTFGIGKSAPFVCSELRTILYNTKNIQDESAFIWKSIFTTHGRPKRRGVGFYSHVTNDDIGEIYTNGINDLKIRPSFINRDHYGTDLYILGFKKPENKQPWNVLFQRVILNNYFAALYDNELRVVLTDEIEERSYELNSSNVIEMMKKDYAMNKNNKNIVTNFPFLDAYTNSQNKVVEQKIEGLGKCKLYIKLDKDYSKRVAYMRLLKMLVFHKQNPRLSSGYSALFICENKIGNKFLSTCEGPTHSDWDKGWNPNPEKAKTLLLRITRFINEVLKSLIVETYSTETILGGLSQFTYNDESEVPGENGSQENSNNEGDDDGFELEDVILEMNDLDYKLPKPSSKKNRKRKVKTEDGSDAGDEPGAGSGGPDSNEGEGGDRPGVKGFGELEGRQDGDWKIKKLRKSQYNYKCFQESGSNDYKLVITTKNEQSCQIKFYANGVDIEKNEEINLVEAIDVDNNTPLAIKNNMIDGVKTTPNPKTIRLVIKDNRKFGVEVELYA